jgi:hypothetical protein
VAGAAVAGAGPRLGLLGPAADGWSRSTVTATSAVLAPLVDPQALLGAALFGIAAAAMAVVLRPRHLAMALLGALLWAAGLEAGLRQVADGGLAGRPALILAAAVAVVIVEFRRRVPRPLPRMAPIPGVRVPIPNHAARPDTAIPGA